MKILVSACLLGEKVRYHGGDAFLDDPILERWRRDGLIVPICPEVEGGLPTPRPAAEIQGGTGEAVIHGLAFVRRRNQGDVTDAFLRGAVAAVALARAHGIRIALLKDLSPSCGSTSMYDGSFTGRRVPGEGVTAAALRHAGVRVFNEHQIEQADTAFREQT